MDGLLETKVYAPALRKEVVHRPRLVERLDRGMDRALTLVSAPAGFGKTTLVAGWIASVDHPTAWLTLDEKESDPGRFLLYLVAALQTAVPTVGHAVLGALGAPPPPPAPLLTALLNDLRAISEPLTLVLDDYHRVDSEAVDQGLALLLEYLPPDMHLVIITREDPQLPLARLRARGRLSELRAADLRFTPAEAARFLNQSMNLALSADQVEALEARTEGWIAGLQLASISLAGRADTTAFIDSFTGSHRFVLDYLVEEVLHQLPAEVHTFLLQTSVLERLCGPFAKRSCICPPVLARKL